jgi:hypothetical protein
LTAPLALGLVGSLATLIFLFEMLRRRQLREKYALLWVAVAVLTIVVALVPGALTRASDLVGVEVPANLLFFLASMLLLLVSIQHSYELGRLEERNRTLAEEVALLRLEIMRKGPDRGAESAD